ncbi:MAG: globin-coupled sensor protein [Rhodospirillaceae bacterium]
MDTHSPLGTATASGAKTGVSGAKTGASGESVARGAAVDPVKIDYDPGLWRLDTATQAGLRGVWAKLGGELDPLLDEFYKFIGKFPENAPHLADKGKSDCLRLLQKEHLQVFFKALFDEDYLTRVHNIGAAHSRVLLPSKFVFAGYSLLLEQMVGSVFRHNRRRPDVAAAQIGALVRGVLTELFFVSEACAQANHNQVMLTSMQGLAETFEQELDQAVEFVRRSAGGMVTSSDTLLEASTRVASDSEEAKQASDKTSNNAQTIAAAAEQLSSSIAEISRQVEHSAAAAHEAATQSQGAKAYADKLSTVSERIGSIVKLIERISKETRLLALNANIEAARAGDAGRGFAVVANEVKNLADQTNRATGEIRTEIEAMQAVIRNTVVAIGDVAAKVEIATSNISAIAGAVTEQEAVTREIAQSAGMTAESIQTVHSRIASVAEQAENSSRETVKLRQDTHGMVDQVIGIKRRVIATLRHNRFADRRAESRQAADLPMTCTVFGKDWPCRSDNLSMTGIQIRSPELAQIIKTERVPVTIDIPNIGRVEGLVICVEQGALHVHLPTIAPDTTRKLADVVDRCRREDAEMVGLAKDTAAHISRLFEAAIDRKEITWEQLWDVDYRLIKDSDPAQFTTKFLALCDRLLPSVQEPLLTEHKNIAFTVTVDRNGYLPTHNGIYSQPQRRGDKVWNTANCRNRRIFDDRTGLSAARNRQPVLVQTYRRDMGGGNSVSMKDISAPIMVHGQHWGGYRIGCRF